MEELTKNIKKNMDGKNMDINEITKNINIGEIAKNINIGEIAKNMGNSKKYRVDNNKVKLLEQRERLKQKLLKKKEKKNINVEK